MNLNINRKVKLKFFLITCLQFFFIGNLMAGQIVVEPMPLSDRLPSNSVQRIFQDKEGFIWLGTLDGLCRYDAYNMLIFRSGINNSSLLTNNEITYITEDNGNRLLVGTKKGLNIVDKETYRITQIPNNEVLDQEIRSILVDADGNIWIGTLKWVYRFTSDFTSWKKFDHELPITSVNSIFQDHQKNIWVSLWSEGVHKYKPEENNFERQTRVGDRNNPFKFFRDNEGRYWLCTWGDGLFRFYPENQNGEMFIHIDITSHGKAIDEKRYFSIVQDGKYGYIWLMSSAGVSAILIDDEEKVVEIDVTSVFKEYNNIFSEFICDKSGNIWIAAFGEGLLTLNMDKPFITNYTLSSIKEKTGFSTNVSALYEDNDGDLWINQNRWGLGIYSPEKNEVCFFHEFPSFNNLAGLDYINCISGFNDDEVWLGPESQAYIYVVRKQNGVPVLFRMYNLKEVTPVSGNPRYFFQDSKQNVWIATTNGLLVKPKGKEDIQTTDFHISGISGMTEDQNGNIWVSTDNNGVYQLKVGKILDRLPLEFVHFTQANGKLASNNIGTISVDVNGDIWMGSNEGHIIRYSSSGGYFENLSHLFDILKEGILNITVDNVGHIWISTNKRIVEYNPENHGLMVYLSNSESVINSFTDNSLFNNGSGKLFYGGNKGISVFTPNARLSEEPGNIRAFVTDLKINSSSVFGQNKNEQLQLISQSIHLFPNDKNIEINFSSFNYANSQKLQYAYQLQGIDDDWIYTDASRPYAFYNKLPKGKYTFLLRVTDINGLWSKDISRLIINKKAAFFETWWAFTIYAILIALFLYVVYSWAMYRIRLNQQLRIAQIEKEKSEELIQTKLRYFTNISHDFLTPLTIICCLIDDAEISLKNKIPQFEIMRANVNRLKRLLRQVLDFRKMESGNMKLKVSHNDVAQFIKDICLSNFAPLMNKKKISFSFNTDSEKIPAYFDTDKVDKSIFNLLSNAVKYTSEGGEIKVELEQLTKEGHIYAIIRISDTGIGIAHEDLNRIFERFYTDKRGASSDTNGIGLSLVKELITLHHGTIKVESEVNKGTVFTVELPIDRESYKEIELNISDKIVIFNKDTDLLKESIDELDLPVMEKENIRLLLVEDNEELLTLMHQLLSKRYNVTTAKNGVQAFDVVKESEINVIVSDVMMPEMNGLELCRLLKSDIETSHIPVILLTAKNSTEERIECYNAGADGYVSKPFDLKLLEARINNFLANKKNKQKEFRTGLTLNISNLGTSPIDKDFLDRTIQIITDNIDSTIFGSNVLAEKLHVSNSSLYRKVKEMTGLSPVEFIRNIRLKHASHLLKESNLSVAEVAYASGFSNPKYFSTCFREEFNLTPREFQKKNE